MSNIFRTLVFRRRLRGFAFALGRAVSCSCISVQTIRERPDDLRSPPDLLHAPLQRIVGSDLAPIAVGKAVIGHCLAGAFADEIGCPCQALFP